MAARGQAVDPAAKIDGLAGEQDSHLRNDLDHGVSGAQELVAERRDRRGVEGGEDESQARAVGTLELQSAIGGARRRSGGDRGLRRQGEEGGGHWSLARTRTILRNRFIQFPWIELEVPANEAWGVTAAHLRGGLANFRGNGLAQVFAVASPGVEPGLKFEQVSGNGRVGHWGNLRE